jgi:hypothetical protein
MLTSSHGTSPGAVASRYLHESRRASFVHQIGESAHQHRVRPPRLFPLPGGKNQLLKEQRIAISMSDWDAVLDLDRTAPAFARKILGSSR